jgi:hypothetical protein
MSSLADPMMNFKWMETPGWPFGVSLEQFTAGWQAGMSAGYHQHQQQATEPFTPSYFPPTRVPMNVLLQATDKPPVPILKRTANGRFIRSKSKKRLAEVLGPHATESE